MNKTSYKELNPKRLQENDNIISKIKKRSYDVFTTREEPCKIVTYGIQLYRIITTMIKTTEPISPQTIQRGDVVMIKVETLIIYRMSFMKL